MGAQHHGEEELARQRELVQTFANQVAGTAKRKYPSGRIGGEDDGELALMVAADTAKGIVRIEFGKPVAWLAMPPEEAIAFANLIRKHADNLRKM